MLAIHIYLGKLQCMELFLPESLFLHVFISDAMINKVLVPHRVQGGTKRLCS